MAGDSFGEWIVTIGFIACSHDKIELCSHPIAELNSTQAKKTFDTKFSACYEQRAIAEY